MALFYIARIIAHIFYIDIYLEIDIFLNWGLKFTLKLFADLLNKYS